MHLSLRFARGGVLVALLIGSAAACGKSSTPPPADAAPPGDAATTGTDSGPVADAAAPADAANPADATANPGDGATGADTWTNYAQGFFSTYCVPCHNSSDAMRDYSTFTDVQRDSALIRCGVTPVALPDCTGFPPPKQFPIGTGPHPSDTERQRIVDWIDAGLPM